MTKDHKICIQSRFAYLKMVILFGEMWHSGVFEKPTKKFCRANFPLQNPLYHISPHNIAISQGGKWRISYSQDSLDSDWIPEIPIGFPGFSCDSQDFLELHRTPNPYCFYFLDLCFFSKLRIVSSNIHYRMKVR